jgi:hypothetical protein
VVSVLFLHPFLVQQQNKLFRNEINSNDESFSLIEGPPISPEFLALYLDSLYEKKLKSFEIIFLKK